MLRRQSINYTLNEKFNATDYFLNDVLLINLTGIYLSHCAKLIIFLQINKPFLDTNKFRLDMAKSLGANHAIRVKGNETVEELTKNILSTLKTKPDVSFDASSSETSIRTGIEVSQLVSSTTSYTTIHGQILHCVTTLPTFVM